MKNNLAGYETKHCESNISKNVRQMYNK